MEYNSKGVSLLLVVSIATITTVFLSQLVGVSKTALLVAFVLSFTSGFILIKIVLDFLIFNEITKIYTALKKLKKGA